MTKVMIGLSGGVDSAVAAFLLKKQGYDVVAGFMRNWDAIANGDFLGNPTLNNSCCPQEADYEDAKAVAEKLGIELFRVDFIKEYWDDVFTYFLKEYQRGRTPNPDIFCNKYIKFDAFLKFAKSKGCDYIATGHYAKRVDKDGKTFLLKSYDQNKDQTYFLSQLNQEQISSCLFPLGDIDKPEVRRIAKELGLSIATKKDSTGVCFIGERNFKEFLKNYLPANKGNIVDINTNEVVGTHDGVLFYTIGQRRGLGIGGISGREAKSWFVVKKDVKKNILYVASGNEDEHLLSDRTIITNCQFNNHIPTNDMHVGCKFRYRQKDQGVTLHMIDDTTVELIFDEPYKAVTTGQAAVFYDEDICLGGGIIDQVYFKNKRIDL
ncbi:MAG: tRNA 2-thiouridine(34) synthase MnmA [Erysipelotrichaceae bacterium]|nr:tRNA 2-thiouridine(34) synthase MnmA [Erysipelotrichaceae bacterium]